MCARREARIRASLQDGASVASERSSLSARSRQAWGLARAPGPGRSGRGVGGSSGMKDISVRLAAIRRDGAAESWTRTNVDYTTSVAVPRGLRRRLCPLAISSRSSIPPASKRRGQSNERQQHSSFHLPRLWIYLNPSSSSPFSPRARQNTARIGSVPRRAPMPQASFSVSLVGLVRLIRSSLPAIPSPTPVQALFPQLLHCSGSSRPAATLSPHSGTCVSSAVTL